jgi:hypothetical protein
MSSVANLTRAIGDITLNGDERELAIAKAKMLTKFAAPNLSKAHSNATAARLALAPQPTNYIHVPHHSHSHSLKHTASTSSLKSKIPTASPTKAAPGSKTVESQETPSLQIGKYDGGLEIDNEKRGSTVFGQAAKDLALDSSIGR